MIANGKHSRFWLLVIFSLTAYTLLAVLFPLLPEYNRAPLRDIRYFAPTPLAGLAYLALFLFLYAGYTAAWRQINGRELTLWAVLIPVLLFCLPLLLTYPINATDVFRYFIRGRVTGFYGESALVTPPAAFPQDPYLPLAGEWAAQTSPYGPLWELLAAAVTIISGQNLLISLFLFKAIAIASHAATGVFIWSACRRLPQALRAAPVLLWTWNPALLYMFAVDGHNDALMIMWLVGGYVLMERRPVTGFLMAFLGVLTKPVALLAMPFLLVALWQKHESWRERWRGSALGGAGALLLTIVAFAPLGSPLDLAVRLLTEASDAIGFSWGVLFVLLGQRLLPSFPLQQAIDLGATFSLVLLALLAFLLLWLVWRGMRATLAIAGVFFAYLITAFTFRIWYSTWPFAWLVLDQDRRRRALSVGFWFLLTAHLSVLIYSYLRVYLLQGDQLVAHLIGVPFTFILPFALARWLPLDRFLPAEVE